MEKYLFVCKYVYKNVFILIDTLTFSNLKTLHLFKQNLEKNKFIKIKVSIEITPRFWG